MINSKIKKLIYRISPVLFENAREIYQYFKYFNRKRQNPKDYPKLIEKRFKELTGIKMDIMHPKGYSQKIQWLKLYDKNHLRTDLTDKVMVRDWIKTKIGEEYLIPIYGIYSSFDEIDFSSLPNQFVIKMNHSSGWNIIVKDKSKLNLKDVKKKLDKWIKLNFAFWSEYEIHYKDIKPRIIIEKYIEDKEGNLNDFKFLCFSGVTKYVWVDFDRFGNHKRNVYDLDWNLQQWNQFTYGNCTSEIKKPENFQKMVEISNELCKGFIHVRVDLYNVDGKIYFGEMTFTNGGGFEGLYPVEYEKIIGDLIKLPID